ncbi:MAG: hypothetical protein LBC75_08890 [Fibromonadaceae bacterium]|jgi:hypothetical protein|nr:hypothetical protein [Fibromonadaceae bacterium]
MRKFIQNYSILVFPAIVGFVTLLFEHKKTDLSVLYVTYLCIVANLIILVPMLKLSNGKFWAVRLIIGLVAMIMFYLFFFAIFLIIPSMSCSIDDAEKFFNTIKMISFGVFVCLLGFWQANIAVILAFLLNDIYAKKIGKIICIKKEVEDAE